MVEHVSYCSIRDFISSRFEGSRRRAKGLIGLSDVREDPITIYSGFFSVSRTPRTFVARVMHILFRSTQKVRYLGCSWNSDPKQQWRLPLMRLLASGIPLVHVTCLIIFYRDDFGTAACDSLTTRKENSCYAHRNGECKYGCADVSSRLLDYMHEFLRTQILPFSTCIYRQTLIQLRRYCSFI